ncbi:uncharacterized protein LOC119349954 [Triticum dicoccoides]|uniref:uncharacterized protein LOC119349954 n=1 Tax=Triticum dicoccoides TaxID=85692 RepID=UPI00189072D0|nr:uncharacterized protein LOC119349954 [Triticum dicoccoides]
MKEAYSWPVLPFDILAEIPPHHKFELAKRILWKYGSLAAIVSFVGVLIYLVASPSKSGAAKGGKNRCWSYLVDHHDHT